MNLLFISLSVLLHALIAVHIEWLLIVCSWHKRFVEFFFDFLNFKHFSYQFCVKTYLNLKLCFDHVIDQDMIENHFSTSILPALGFQLETYFHLHLLFIFQLSSRSHVFSTARHAAPHESSAWWIAARKLWRNLGTNGNKTKNLFRVTSWASRKYQRRIRN